MSLLGTILDHTSAETARRKKVLPVQRLKEHPFFSRTTGSLTDALASRSFAVIAEVKKASPTRGVIRERFDPVAIAADYERGGAAAISVLTDEEFFQGKLDYLEAIRGRVTLPLLRKDFVLDPYQLYEAKAAGADAVLLIVAALEPFRLVELEAEARSLGLECLVEVHTEEEMDIANANGSPLIGINNRDLSTFRTDLETSLRLSPRARKGALCVSESGIGTKEDIDALARAGIHAVLVGESFMRAENPGEALAAFRALGETVT